MPDSFAVGRSIESSGPVGEAESLPAKSSTFAYEFAVQLSLSFAAAELRSPLKVRVSLSKVELFDPNVAVAYIVTLILQFQATRHICDATTAVVAPIDP